VGFYLLNQGTERMRTHILALAVLGAALLLPGSSLGGEMGYVGGGNTAGILEDATRGPFVDDDGDGTMDDGEHRLSSNPIIYALDYSNDATLSNAEFQTAVDATELVKGTLQLPCITIGLDDPNDDGVGITIDDPIVLQGCSSGGTVIRNNASFVMDSEDDAVILVSAAGTVLRDLYIYPTDHTDTGGSQVRGTASHIRMERVRIQGHGTNDPRSNQSTGFYCDGAMAPNLLDVRITGWQYGIRINKNGGEPCNEMAIFGGHVTNNLSGVFIDEDGAGNVGCGGLSIYGTDIEGWDTIGIDHVDSAGADANGCHVRLYGAHLENHPVDEDNCIASEDPYPCCTGEDTGTCLEDSANVFFRGVGGSLTDHGSTWGGVAANNIRIAADNKHTHTSVGGKWNAVYSNASCTDADIPLDCCTGSGTGTCGDFDHNGTGILSVTGYNRNTAGYTDVFTSSGTGVNLITYSSTLRSADCTAEPSGGYEFYGEGQLCAHSDGTVYVCNPDATDDFCNGDGGDSWDEVGVAEANNLEITYPPNVADGEVYIGTGPGAGAWVAGLAACAPDEKPEYVPGSPDTITCEAIGGLGSADISGLDVSADTNLAVTAPVVLTDGTISVNENASIATSTGGTLAINTATIATVAGDYDLPDDACDSATGNWVVLYVRDAEAVSLTVNDSSDTINYYGLSLGANDELDSPGPGTALASVAVVCFETNNWYATSSMGAWTDGGVP
jgi:hypothetical protein